MPVRGESHVATEPGTTHSYFQAFPSKLTFNTEKILLRVGANLNISVVKWGLEKLVWKSRILSTLFHWSYLKTSILWMNSQILKCSLEWFSVLCSREEEPCQVRFRRTDQAATRPWTYLPCFTRHEGNRLLTRSAYSTGPHHVVGHLRHGWVFGLSGLQIRYLRLQSVVFAYDMLKVLGHFLFYSLSPGAVKGWGAVSFLYLRIQWNGPVATLTKQSAFTDRLHHS